MNTHPTTDRLRQHLQTLSEPELPDALWGRLDDARQRRLHRRRVGTGLGGATAVVLIVLAVVPLPNRHDVSSSPVAPIVASQPAPLPSVQVATDNPSRQVASNEILAKDKLANTMPANTAPIVKQQPVDLNIVRSQSDSRQLDARLRSLDRNLQAAYRRGSSEAEIAQLWRTRQMLLADKTGNAIATNPIRI